MKRVKFGTDGCDDSLFGSSRGIAQDLERQCKAVE